jgi:hypothetical protein
MNSLELTKTLIEANLGIRLTSMPSQLSAHGSLHQISINWCLCTREVELWRPWCKSVLYSCYQNRFVPPSWCIGRSNELINTWKEGHSEVVSGSHKWLYTVSRKRAAASTRVCRPSIASFISYDYSRFSAVLRRSEELCTYRKLTAAREIDLV